MNSTIVAPSILASDFSCLADQIHLVERAGADWIHLDVMDGEFVPNISFGPPVISALRKHTSLPFDAHLMIAHPERYIERFRDAGADVITVHQEACRHLNRVINQIKDTGAKAGVAINPATPVGTLEDVLDLVDLVLVMSVNPGFGGQKFIPSTTKKLRQTSSLISQSTRSIYLEVDGGIDSTNADSVRSAGASVIVAGTSVFAATDMTSAIRSLR